MKFELDEAANHGGPLVLGLIGLLRHLQPVLSDLEPAFFVEQVSCPLGLLPTLVGVSSEFVRPRRQSLATSHLSGNRQTVSSWKLFPDQISTKFLAVVE